LDKTGKERVSMGMEILIAIGVLHVKLFAYQVSIVYTAN